MPGSFSDDLAAERGRREQQKLNRMASLMLRAARQPVPMPARRRGGMDLSSITCGCSCHTVYGSGSARKPTQDSCDHCRVYG